MSWLSKLFGIKPQAQAAPAPEVPVSNPLVDFWVIPFGRYSDNNKTYSQIQKWYEAESCFKREEYDCTLDLFLDHLCDQDTGNVICKKENSSFFFQLVQGSAIIEGQGNDKTITARANLPTVSARATPVMNRMLLRNYSLRYARFALDEPGGFCMLLDIPVKMASPNRLYYGLRELALNADQLIGELNTDFDNPRLPSEQAPKPIPEKEIDVKFKYFHQWINESLKQVADLQADAFSGAIAYLLLTTVYRIQFLITPEGVIQKKLDDLTDFYWRKKDELSLLSRNEYIAVGLRALLDVSRDEFAQSLYHSRKTFSEVAPPPRNKMAEHIRGANRDAEWYIVNQYEHIARVIVEYGIVYSLYSYSVPTIITQLSTVLLYTLHTDFFNEMGIHVELFQQEKGRLNPKRINAGVYFILNEWTEKYPQLRWDQSRILFDDILNFARTYSEQIASLNLEIRR